MDGRKVVVDLEQIDLLEQRIVKATELIRSLRRDKDEALARLRDAEQSLAQAQRAAAVTDEDRRRFQEAVEQLDLLKEERTAIRGRVHRMLELMSGVEDGAVAGRREH